MKSIGFVCRLPYLDHSQRVIGDLCYCAKFGCDRCISVVNMKLSMLFGSFGLKTPTHTHKTGVLGGFADINLEQCQTKPQKGTSMSESASFESSNVKIYRAV